jgi:hypothetical protein
MKKVNKKALLILSMLLISTVMLTALQVTAVSDDTLDDIEYYSDDIPEEKLEQIVKAMFEMTVNAGIGISPASILCIFGHNIQTGTTTIIEHRFWVAAPRCRRTLAQVQFCTRNSCSYFVTLSESVGRIVCCS